MSRKPAVTGSTVAERRQAREQRRQHNRVTHVAARAKQARNGREQLVVACNAAMAAGKRITDDARKQLAATIIQAADKADVPENRKAQS
jgi:hypothetical protein